jgi:hypothetical protein
MVDMINCFHSFAAKRAEGGVTIEFVVLLISVPELVTNLCNQYPVHPGDSHYHEVECFPINEIEDLLCPMVVL